jgi:hypothetical protein
VFIRRDQAEAFRKETPVDNKKDDVEPGSFYSYQSKKSTRSQQMKAPIKLTQE